MGFIQKSPRSPAIWPVNMWARAFSQAPPKIRRQGAGTGCLPPCPPPNPEGHPRGLTERKAADTRLEGKIFLQR